MLSRQFPIRRNSAAGHSPSPLLTLQQRGKHSPGGGPRDGLVSLLDLLQRKDASFSAHRPSRISGATPTETTAMPGKLEVEQTHLSPESIDKGGKLACMLSSTPWPRLGGLKKTVACETEDGAKKEEIFSFVNVVTFMTCKIVHVRKSSPFIFTVSCTKVL